MLVRGYPQGSSGPCEVRPIPYTKTNSTKVVKLDWPRGWQTTTLPLTVNEGLGYILKARLSDFLPHFHQPF